MNLVTYHHARASAMARAANRSVHIVEVTNTDVFEPLEHKTGGAANYRRHTLMPGTPHADLRRRDVHRALDRALDELNPAVVCLNGWSLVGAWESLAWCRRRRVPAIMMSETTADDAPRSPWKEWVKRRILAMCDAALVGGERHREYLIDLGMPANRIFLGYDVVDNAHFAAGAAAARTAPDASHPRIQTPENYFLASARFTPKKNLANLVRAYHRYRSALASQPESPLPWDLVILGDGPLRTTLVELIAQLDLTSSVHLPGFKQYDELPAYYGLARAFVHASTVEQWGLVVNEAMASGLPILLSERCGCAPTLLDEGQNGFAFDPEDIDALAQCMRRMTNSSPPMRDQMGRRSEAIVAEFGPQRFADGLRKAIDAATAAGPAPIRFTDALLLRALLTSAGLRA